MSDSFAFQLFALQIVRTEACVQHPAHVTADLQLATLDHVVIKVSLLKL